MAETECVACLNCGAHYDLSEGSFPLGIISDTSYGQLRAFFMKQLDDWRCRACSQPTGLRPTLVISNGEKHEHLYSLGDHLIAAPDRIRKIFVDGLRSGGARVEAYATLDELRAAYAKRIVSTIEHILQGLHAVSSDFKEFSTNGWRAFPSNQFAATLVGLSTRLPGVSVDFPLGIEEALSKIGTLQTMVWFCLCNTWSVGFEEGHTFEADLDQFMSPDAIFDEAADEFLRCTEPSVNMTPVARYCLHAMRASLYSWGKKPNPRLREWADSFVEQEVQRRLLGERASPYLIALEISTGRAQDTIPYEELFDSCLSQLEKRGMMIRPQLGEIGQKLGYQDFGDQLLFAIRFRPNEGSALGVDEVLKLVRGIWKGGPPEALLMIASKLLDLLGKDRPVDAVCGLADGLREILGNDTETRARVQVWLCSNLLKQRSPKAALERLGDKAQHWEDELSEGLRVALWTERSNALRMSGRGAEALAVAERVIADLKTAGQPIPFQLRRNLGILFRETGRQEEALEIFLKLLPDASRDLELLDSIVVTYVSLGRLSETILYLEKMLEMACGPYADRRPGIVTNLAATKVAIGERREALALLREITVDKSVDARVLVPYASTWVTLSVYGEQLEEEDREKISALLSQLKNLHEIILKAGDRLTQIQIERLLAWLVDVLDVEHPNPYWVLVDKNAREFEGVADPMAIVALARNALAERRPKEMHDYLLEMSSAVAKRYGPESHVSLKVQSLSHLRPLIEKLVDLAVNSASFEDLRLIAELGRDMLGRFTASSISPDMLSEVFIAPTTKNIGQLGGPTAVFEWTAGPGCLYGLATFIAADGAVTECFQKPMQFDFDLEVLSERVTHRLSVWHGDRAGSPLELEGWKAFEHWLTTELEGRLAEHGRLVIIEHGAFAGLQWHVAAAPRWRVSYAPSWSTLLRARRPTAAVERGPLGLALAPKFRESADNLRALENSVTRTVDLADRLGVTLKSSLREACDRDALIEMLEGTTVAKVLCHGFVDPDDDLVALMVAHIGELPLGNSVAANTSAGRQHRVDWRDFQQLKAAPAVIFSAACSSGQSHYVGLGEKLGLFSTLRRAGTRSFVAPRWDINPEVVLPVLDDAMERWFRDGVELGEALHAACSDASALIPRWQAWAIALEGDWK